MSTKDRIELLQGTLDLLILRTLVFGPTHGHAIAKAIEYVKANNVPAVFCESTVSDAPMQQVVGATGAKFGGVLYVDSLSEADGPVPTYLDLIRHDSKIITEALTGSAP